MVSRWSGAVASIIVTTIIVTLVVVDVTDRAFREWWLEHAFTTDTVAGLLVLGFTVLVADQVLALRTVKQRARATAAQAAIVLSQAARTAKAVTSARNQTGELGRASDEVRSYLTMLLTAAPMLLDSKVAQTFLESAQYLAAELGRTLTAITKAPNDPVADHARLDHAVDQLQAASRPLMHVLDPEQLRVTEL